MVRLTDHPYMTIDVYCGRKTTTQQQQLYPCLYFPRKESLNSAVPDDMIYIEPITETEENLEVYQVCIFLSITLIFPFQNNPKI